MADAAGREVTLRLERCRVLCDGYAIEHGDLMVGVDLDDPKAPELLQTILQQAVRRDGQADIGMYVLQLFDRFGDVVSNYVTSK